MDQESEGAEIMIVRGRHEASCPARALKQWIKAAAIRTGPMFRKANKACHVEGAGGVWDAFRQIILWRAAEAGVVGSLTERISPHGLRAGCAIASKYSVVNFSNSPHDSYSTPRIPSQSSPRCGRRSLAQAVPVDTLRR